MEVTGRDVKNEENKVVKGWKIGKERERSKNEEWKEDRGNGRYCWKKRREMRGRHVKKKRKDEVKEWLMWEERETEGD